MPKQRLALLGRALRGLAALFLFVASAAAAQVAPASVEETVPVGESRERSIAAGESQAWKVMVPADTTVLVTVEQRSIDLVVEARGPGDKEPYAITASRDSWGTEVLLLDRAGENRIEVRSRDKSAWLGRYDVRIEDLPERTGARHDALALMSRAGRETLPDTQESRKQAEATSRQALVAWRALGDRAGDAERLTSIAMLESESSELPASTTDFLAALPIWRDLQSPQREAAALNWLGVIYLDTEDVEKARESLKRSLSLWHEIGALFNEAQTRNNLCSLEHRKGSLQVALACYKDNLDFSRLHNDAKLEAETLNNIGGVYDLQGEPDDALKFYQQALVRWQNMDDHRKEAGTLSNIGTIYRAIGELQNALKNYNRSRELLGPHGDPGVIVKVLNNIGTSYIQLGELRRAVHFLEDALKIHQDVGDRQSKIVTLNNLGTVWRKLGEPEKALDWHRQALELATLLKNAQQRASSRLGLAAVDLDRGDPSAALREIEAVQSETVDPGAQASALFLQARALTLAGRSREALALFQEALKSRKAMSDRAGEGETLYALALAERSLGLATEARSHAEAAVNLAEELRTKVLSVDLRSSFLATRQQSYSLLIDLLMDRDAVEPGKGYDRQAFAVSERARARGLIDILSAGNPGHSASIASSGSLAQRSSLLRRLSAKVDQRQRQGGARAEALGHEIDAILAEIDEVEAEIRSQDPRFAAFSAPKPITLEEVSSWLEPGTMLFEYSLGDDRSFLWAIESGRFRSFVLPGKSKIESLVRQVYEEMSTAGSGGARRGDDAAQLAKILLGPLWSDHRESVEPRRLIVVPDGALAILPFAALPIPVAGHSRQEPGIPLPLLERLEVISIPSATTLAVQRQRLKGRAEAPKWAAVFADPVFSPDDPRLSLRTAANRPKSRKATTATTEEPALRGPVTGGLPPVPERLPATRREAEALAALAPAGKVKLDLDLAASRDAALAGDLRDYRIVHFATHAVADLENPELSGLLLSQVDAQGHPREGFLGLSDIYELDLGADLVVLSGCRTALGKEVRGEGLMGLTRGFQYAGVPRVVASLWPVQDRATAELMTRFYRAMWRDGRTPAAALREAQRALRHDPRYRDPHAWAGFVLQGDWN